MDRASLILYCRKESPRWQSASWAHWVNFRKTNSDWRPIPGVRDGDYFFVICILNGCRALTNIVPHRCSVDVFGRQVGDATIGLAPIERDRVRELSSKRRLTPLEEQEHRYLEERTWAESLPPACAAQTLIALLSDISSEVLDPACRFVSALESRTARARDPAESILTAQ